MNPKNPEELQFLSELLKKLGVNAKILSDMDTEDLGLALLMKEADRSEVTSEEEVIAKLKG